VGIALALSNRVGKIVERNAHAVSRSERFYPPYGLNSQNG